MDQYPATEVTQCIIFRIVPPGPAQTIVPQVVHGQLVPQVLHRQLVPQVLHRQLFPRYCTDSGSPGTAHTAGVNNKMCQVSSL